ncbi:GGDEF domain-containing protein [Mesobacillus subterraneus]|uniref:GGDEF domain-containing protein n=1 Tax=Mesobacillus subterraneus TaxID=285983 RepID=UPI001CFEAE2C|nr:GGDEF domain-containing protein [Mesobacillus subterraneus]WLR54499.1 GGDEF domain-containing protein [Mesobacillus subterraneus]
MQVTIGEIAEQVIVVTPSTKCEDVYTIFKEKPAIEGVVVCSDDRPIGLVTKTTFYQKLSTQYGFDLFMKRTIDLVMIPDPLIVDHSVPITETSAQAMDRAQEHLYDYVIVTKEDRLIGIVSIRNLLMKLAEEQISIARYSNPLTGLPGNFEIKNALKTAIDYEKYTILYIDINLFKAFNDTFGFKLGDEVIQYTATILKETVLLRGSTFESFIGHIGGDDFIAILPHHEFKIICQSLINRFEQFTHQFYTEEELEQGYIHGISRMGVLENIPLVGLSIAVIQNTHKQYNTIEDISLEAARIKKRCKSLRRSVFLTSEKKVSESFPQH